MLISTKSDKDKKEGLPPCKPPSVVEVRPRILEADVVRFQNNKEKWVAFVGLLDGHPYEIFTVQLQRANQFDNLFNRHPVAKHAGNQFCIVPVFLVELLRQSFNGRLISAFVLELEVVTFGTVFIHIFMIRPQVTLLGSKIPSSSSCKPVNIS